MKILIACEESQTIATRFRNLGHDAYSCDLLDCSGGRPDIHIQGDCLPLLNGNCSFTTADGKTHSISGRWDLIIAHPPCTYLTLAGNRWFDVEKYGDKAIKRMKDREDGADFFMKFTNADCDHIAIENPIGIMSSRYRKPNQIIQPYQFGDPSRKPTCLWTKGLPLLEYTNVVEPDIYIFKDGPKAGHGESKDLYEALKLPPAERARVRSKTYPGIADAIVDQWGKYVEQCLNEENKSLNEENKK